MLADRKVLGAMRFAFAAADAVRCTGHILPEGRTHKIFFETGEFTLRVKPVIGGKGTGNIHTLGARCTITAAGAAHFDLGIDGLDHFL